MARRPSAHTYTGAGNPPAPFAFEVRANVAIRIVVERVDLEPHPLLSLDSNGTRRAAWQSIATAAIEGLAPPALPVPVKRGPYKKRQPPTDEPAHTHTCTHCRRAYTPLPQHASRSRYCARTPCQRARSTAAARAKREQTNGGAA